MSEIVGYIGKKNALPILIEKMKQMSFKEYDSSGILVLSDNKAILVKVVGRLENLEKKLKNKKIEGNIGLGHLRWASVGRVITKNAHPHFDCKKEIFLVHSGMIENHKELRRQLIKEGHILSSETDSELICHLIENYFQGNLEEAVKKTIQKIRGAYAFVVVSRKDPQKIVAVKFSSPLFFGKVKDGILIASDKSIFTKFKPIETKDGEIIVFRRDKFHILKERINFQSENLDKGIYPHFMLKEIFEEPEIIENVIRGRVILEKGMVKFGGLDALKEKLKKINNLILIGCGSSFYAAKFGEILLQEYAKINARSEIASEFRYLDPFLNKSTAVISISQSGESTDTLAVLKKMKEKGMMTIGITNVISSSQAKETDAGIYLRAGTEIAVASTKTFLSQLITLVMLTIYFGRQRSMDLKTSKRILQELIKTSNFIREILNRRSEIEKLAKKYQEFKNFYVLGMKYNFPIALEGALKLKEVSYLHAEGICGGELKHGPIALIDKNFLTIAICPSDSVYDKMKSNLQEIKKGNGLVIAIATQGNREIQKLADDVFYIPKTLEILTPILTVIPLQLLSYYFAVLLKREIDKPRNLVKSVIEK